MHQYILASLLLTLSLSAQADTLTLNDIKAQNGVQLSLDDLKQLMPSAKVTHYTSTGNTRNWSNDSDGEFVASSYNPTTRIMSQVHGTWQISNDGTYCVTLKWGRGPDENWCRYIFKVGEKYFGVKSLTDTSGAHQFEFSK